MTKREICKRLMDIRDDALLAAGAESKNGDQKMVDFSLYVVNDIRRLLLDLAAPEEEKEKRKPHGVIIDQCGKETPRCLNCNGEAKIVHNGFGTGDDWAYCSKCGFSCRLKRGEGEK